MKWRTAMLRPLLVALYDRRQSVSEAAVKGLRALVRPPVGVFDDDVAPADSDARWPFTLLDLAAECVTQHIDVTQQTQFGAVCQLQRQLFKTGGRRPSMHLLQQAYLCFHCCCVFDTVAHWMQQPATEPPFHVRGESHWQHSPAFEGFRQLSECLVRSAKDAKLPSSGVLLDHPCAASPAPKSPASRLDEAEQGPQQQELQEARGLDPKQYVGLSTDSSPGDPHSPVNPLMAWFQRSFLSGNDPPASGATTPTPATAGTPPADAGSGGESGGGGGDGRSSASASGSEAGGGTADNAPRAGPRSPTTKGVKHSGGGTGVGEALAQALPTTPLRPATLVAKGRGHELDNAAAPHPAAELLLELIEVAMARVELTKCLEGVLQLTHRDGEPHNSVLFWSEADLAAKNIFPQQPVHQRLCLLLLALCKTASLPLRTTNRGDLVGKDLASKLLCLTALNDLLRELPRHVRESEVWGFVVRRLIMSTLLVNTEIATKDRRLVKQLLTTLTTLWRHYRVHLKVEIAVYVHEVLLRLLRAPPQQRLMRVQKDVLDTLSSWIDSQHLSEMFLNFDMDRGVLQELSIYEHLVGTVCSIAEGEDLTDEVPEEQRQLAESRQLRALEVITQIMRALMDISGHANSMAASSRVRTMSVASGGGWEQVHTRPSMSDADPLKECPEAAPSPAIQREEDPLMAAASAAACTPPTRSLRKAPFRRSGSSFTSRQLEFQHNKEILSEGLEIANKKGVKKCINFLLAKNFLNDTPRDIATFIRMYHKHFDDADIGDFLGSGEGTYFDAIRVSFCSAISFKGMTLDAALRHFLTASQFRLPGEAQKIDRLMSVFAQSYFQDNKDSNTFKNSDTVFVLAFAVIMLNTDLHRANAGRGKKQRKMTKEGFLDNVRRVDDSLDKAMVEQMYDSVANNQIALPYGDAADAAGAGGACQTSASDNLASALVRSSELLRSVALHHHKFLILGVDTRVSVEMVATMFNQVWWMVHSVITSVLDQPDLPLSATLQCLDTIQCSISTAIFLDLAAERQAFALLLLRIKRRLGQDASATVDGGLAAAAASGAADAGGPSRNPTDCSEPWFQQLQVVRPERAIEVIAELQGVISQLRTALEDDHEQDTMQSVISRIDKGAKLLDSKEQQFVREGDLVKKCQTGRHVTYRFFLFSDQLLYAHKTFSGDFKVHKQLILSGLEVRPVSGYQDCAFQILHPRKSFVVIAESPAEKHAWMHDVSTTAATSQKRRQSHSGPAVPQLRPLAS